MMSTTLQAELPEDKKNSLRRLSEGPVGYLSLLPTYAKLKMGLSTLLNKDFKALSALLNQVFNYFCKFKKVII